MLDEGSAGAAGARGGSCPHGGGEPKEPHRGSNSKIAFPQRPAGSPRTVQKEGGRGETQSETVCVCVSVFRSSTLQT